MSSEVSKYNTVNTVSYEEVSQDCVSIIIKNVNEKHLSPCGIVRRILAYYSGGWFWNTTSSQELSDADQLSTDVLVLLDKCNFFGGSNRRCVAVH